MAIPAYVRYVVRGHLGTDEVFNWAFNSQESIDTQADLQAAADAVAGYLTASTGPGTALKLNMRPVDGVSQVAAYQYEAGATAAVRVAVADAVVAGTGTGSHPYQVALCVSLLTGEAGRQRRGRLFLPATGRAINSNSGQMSQADAQGVADAIAGLFNTVGGIAPIVISRVGAMVTPITQVRVDTRLDTQRGRANKQLATATATSAVT